MAATLSEVLPTTMSTPLRKGSVLDASFSIEGLAMVMSSTVVGSKALSDRVVSSPTRKKQTHKMVGVMMRAAWPCIHGSGKPEAI